MDALKEIKEKLAARGPSAWQGIESVVKHIEIAERHYARAKRERDEHLFTDVIYRTNHAFEGILKEAYVVLDNQPGSRKTPFEIEEYLLRNRILRGRVVDMLTNYRQNWRNPSTHDHQLFFSEQESFLAITSVTAFVSILLDQIFERFAFEQKLKELESEAVLARERMMDFDLLSPIDKLYKILLSYASYYLKNFDEMSRKNRATANAEMAAFIKRVAPEIDVVMDEERRSQDRVVRFDLLVTVHGVEIGIETRDPRTADEDYLEDQAATNQLAHHLKLIGIKNGIVFFYPGMADHVAVVTTGNTSWPSGVNLREVYSDDPDNYPDDDQEEAVDLTEHAATPERSK